MINNQYYGNMYQTLIRVNGIDGAKAYQMMPNSTVALFDNNDDLMYIKTTDGAGFPSIRIFRFSEEIVSHETSNEEKYVTMDEFNKLKEMIENGKYTISKSKLSAKQSADDVQ